MNDHNFIYFSPKPELIEAKTPSWESVIASPLSYFYFKHATSEKILYGEPSTQDTPEAVYELQRILRLHLDAKLIQAQKLKHF